MIKINNYETKRFITSDPKELMNYIQGYQSKIMFLIYIKEININNILFSDIGIAK